VNFARRRLPSAQSIAPETKVASASESNNPNFKLLDPALKTRMLIVALANE
jgi:hypothetical protein